MNNDLVEIKKGPGLQLSEDFRVQLDLAYRRQIFPNVALRHRLTKELIWAETHYFINLQCRTDP